jgi:hypothetical protein
MSNVTFIIVYVDDVAGSEAFASILGRPAVDSSPGSPVDFVIEPRPTTVCAAW